MSNYNIILDTDSYKLSHYLAYPPKTTGMFSYLESRGGLYPATLFSGIQPLLKKLALPVTADMVLRAKPFIEEHGLPFNLDGWLRIARELNGKLPLHIRAVKEGKLIPTHNALVTVESTDPESAWLVGHVETMLSRIWYPITVSTTSFNIKKLILKYLDLTSDDPAAEIMFKLHDFGSRGVSSFESAQIGGAAHLVNFMGSDTVAAIRFANEQYSCAMSGFSIIAAEHSTVTSWGGKNEAAAFERMLSLGTRGGLVAVVSDSYDLQNAVEHIWGEVLRQKVIDSGVTVVVRPDSGDPTTTVMQTLRGLESKFGVQANLKGFKVLNNVRVIQGDGVDQTSIAHILEAMHKARFSATNIAFGMGGALLQKMDRDTQRFAYKCSSIIVDGEYRDVFKNPVTDPSKASKKGRLDLHRDHYGNYSTVRLGNKEFSSGANSALDDVFLNGEVLREQTLIEIRSLANAALNQD